MGRKIYKPRKARKTFKRKKIVKHSALILILKIICVVLLLLVPINAPGDDVTANPSPDAQMQDLAYWPPLIAKLEDLYSKHPNDPQVIQALANAYNNYGVLLARNKQWSQAESYLQQSINISPDPTLIKKNLSNVYYEQGMEIYQNHSTYTTYQAGDAKQLATQAINFDPQNVNGYLLLGDIEYMEQNMPAAERAWQTAAQLVPDNAAVKERLAKITRETNIESPMNAVFNPYFNIKIDPGVQQNPNFDINMLLNYAHDNVAPDFQFYQNFKVPVVVYNKSQYHEEMIDAPGWVEAAYDGKIRITIAPDQKKFDQLYSDVAHEYTHVIVGMLTNNNCPRWFNEGLAKYEEYRHGIPPRIYLLALAYNTNEILDFNKLNEALISPNKEEALLAYQQSFSFVYFIVQRYGMSKIIALLKLLGTNAEFASAVQQIYGVPLTTLESNWRLWLTDFITNWADKPALETSPANVGY